MKNFKFVLSFTVLFTAIIFLASCAMQMNAADDTYLTVDINPSVELIVNKREKVIYANALNEDAEVLLAEIDVIGMDLEDALDLIIETATVLGYIDPEAEETFVYVSSISKNTDLAEKINERAKEHINKAFGNRMMMGRAEEKGYMPAFVTEAQAYGVTPGFLFLAYKAVEASDELILEDALTMTVEELQSFIKIARDAHKEVIQQLRTDFLEARQVLFDQYLPQIQSLEAQIEEKEALLLEAAEEEKAAIQVEIDQLVLDLEALKLELREAVAALRGEFLEQGKAIREQMKEEFQHRKDQFQQRFQEFVQKNQERKDEIKNRISQWQNRP